MAGSFGIEAARAALDSGNPALVWRRQIADTETPVSAALKLMEDGRGDYLLESVEGGETRGRHSMIGLAPDLVFRADGEKAAINRTWLKDREAFAAEQGDSLSALRNLVKACQMDVPEELPRALACLVGYFGYETIGLVEKLPRAPQSDLDLPDMLFVRPTVILIFDRLADELFHPYGRKPMAIAKPRSLRQRNGWTRPSGVCPPLFVPSLLKDDCQAAYRLAWAYSARTR